MKKYIIWILVLISQSCFSEVFLSTETQNNGNQDITDQDISRVLSREARGARQIHSANDANFLNPFNWLQVVRTVSQMKGEVRTLTSTMEEMSATIAKHEKNDNNNEVDTRVTTAGDTKAISDIQSNIMNIYSHIKALRTKLKKKGSKIKLQLTKQKAIKVNMLEKELNATIITVNKTIEEFIPMVNVSAIQSLVTQLGASSVTELVTNLTTIVTAMQTTVTALETKNTALETEVTSLKTTLTAAETKITALEAKDTALEAKDTALEAKDTALEAKDTALETKVTALEAKDAATDACFGDITSSDCTASTSGKTGVIAQINANTAAVATKCEDSTCTATKTSLTKVETCFGDTSSGDCLGTTGTGLIKSLTDHQTCFTDKSSSTCPASASGKTGIKAAITDLEEGPMFSCTYQGADITTLGNAGTIVCPGGTDEACILIYTTCDVNQGITTGSTSDTSVATSTGKFTVPKKGRYRFTFMGLAASGGSKKAIVTLKKSSGGTITSEARAVVQNKLGTAAASTGNFYITISIDVIRDCAKNDEVYIHFNLGANVILQGKASVTAETIFTGQLVSLIP